MKPIYLVDASIYIFRSYYSMPDTIFDARGEPVHAVYGFTFFLIRLLEQYSPSYIAACFDKSLSSSFRSKIYPEYKANRELPPPDLKRQMQLCERVAQGLGIKTYASKRYEADDLIGTLASSLKTRKRPVVILSSDKDLLQLLQPGDVFWDFARDIQVAYHQVKKHKGVTAEQIADFLALTGDPVDNIPGVPGVGGKIAAALLARFQSIDELYENLHKVRTMKLRGAARVADLLEQHKAVVDLARRLTLIKTDAAFKHDLQSLKWSGISETKMKKLVNELGAGTRFQSALDRLR
jgi:5'-3' exonuclease